MNTLAIQQQPVRVRPLAKGEAPLCEQIMRSLPEWCGIEEAIVSYALDLVAMETWVAAREGGIQGFITLRRHNPHSGEIQVLAVRREWHRKGIGRLLVRELEDRLIRDGMAYLQVKTLGPSRESAPYAATRAFYGSLGFVPLEENRLWGEVNPCQVFVRHLACGHKPVSGVSVHR
jgi:GNAT superfamily N-acetyltransferase